MAKVRNPLLSLTAHGALARAVIYNLVGENQYARRYAKPSGAPSAAQISQRSAYSLAIAAWHALTPTQRADWNTTGNLSAITGYNAYLRWHLSLPPSACITQWDGGSTTWDGGSTCFDNAAATDWDGGATTWDGDATTWDI